MRCLAPAGGFPTPRAIFNSGSEAELLSTFENQLKDLFQGQPVSFCSSGKQAIEIISQYLSSKGYKRLVLGAYNCPDVVAAALRGGLKVSLVDTDPRTLEPIFLQHDPNQDVLLVSNLYGLVDSIKSLTKYKIIDDGAQASQSFDSNQRVGGRGLGVLSFGRGKAISAIGGGAVVGFSENPEIVSEKFISWLKLLVYSTLEKPSLYGIPQSLPFLKLGETKFEPDYKDGPLTTGQIATASAAIKLNVNESKIRQANTELWKSTLDSKKVILPVNERQNSSGAVLTRFPILIPENRNQIYSELAREGLGVSLSYPQPLDVLCHGYIEEGSFEGARKIAMQIITLPTHRYVTKADIEKAAGIINKHA